MGITAILLAAGWINIGPGGGGWLQSMTASRYDAERLWIGCDVGGVYYSENGGHRYETRNEGLENLFVETIAEHPQNPDLVLIGTKGGVYKTTDRGKTWSLKREGFPPTAHNRNTVIISKILWDAKGGAYASVGAPRYSSAGRGEVYYSADAGETWKMVVEPGQMESSLTILDMVAVGDELLVSTPTNGLFRSADGGKTWQSSNDGLPEHLRLRKFGQSLSNPNRLYLTLRGKPGETPWDAGAVRSDDGGRNWTRCGTKGLETQGGKPGAPDMNCSWYDCICVAPDNPDTVYMAGGSWWCKGVWRSEDAGETWKKVFRPEHNEGWLKSWNGATTSMTVSPLPPHALTFGTGCCVYRTEDRGESWSQRYTTDNGDGTSRSCGLELTCVHTINPSIHKRGRFYINYFDIGLMRADDYGNQFKQLMKGVPKYADCFAVVEHPTDPDHLWAAFGGWSANWGWIGESTDGGESWKLHDEAGNGWEKATPRQLVRVGGTEDFTLACTASRRFLRLSDDFGKTWRQLSTNDFPEATLVSALASDGTTLYAGTSVDNDHIGTVWASDDRGKTWRKASEGTKLGTVTSLSADAKGGLYATTKQGWNKACGQGPGGAWYSPDRGKTWNLVYSHSFCTGIVSTEDSLVVSLTDHPFHDRYRGDGVMRSFNNGKTWHALNDSSLFNRSLECLVVDPFSPRTIVVGTGGNSAFIRQLNPATEGRKSVDTAHAELLKFVSADGLLQDYLGDIPTETECKECRPNAKGWWTPIENGPMFTGPWLAAVCERAKASGKEEDRALARRLADGLLAASRCSEVPGFIARGIGAEPKIHYPVGSIDQTLPWFYGLWAYYRSGIADAEHAQVVKTRMLEVARALEKNGWKCPNEPPFDQEDCGDFLNDALPFRNASHGLFLFRILAELDPARKPFYREVAKGKAKGCDLTRLEVCAKGYETDLKQLPWLEPHLLWIYVTAQGCLKELAKLEPWEKAFRDGLAANAERASKSLDLYRKYDNSTEKPFRYGNWRTGYEWRPQKTLAESDKVSWTGKKEVLGTRKNFERDYMTAPLSAAAICAFAGEGYETFMRMLAHFDWSTFNISEFFFAEVAWFAY